MNKKAIYCFLPALSGLAATIVIVIISTLAIISMGEVENNIDFVYSYNVESIHTILDITENMAQINETIYLSSDIESISSLLAANKELQSAYKAGVLTDIEIILFELFSEENTRYQAEVLNWLDLEQNGSHQEAQDYAREVVAPLYSVAAENLKELADYQYTDAQHAAYASSDTFHANSILIIESGTLSVIFCLIVSISSTIILFVSFFPKKQVDNNLK